MITQDDIFQAKGLEIQIAQIEIEIASLSLQKEQLQWRLDSYKDTFALYEQEDEQETEELKPRRLKVKND